MLNKCTTIISILECMVISSIKLQAILTIKLVRILFLICLYQLLQIKIRVLKSSIKSNIILVKHFVQIKSYQRKIIFQIYYLQRLLIKDKPMIQFVSKMIDVNSVCYLIINLLYTPYFKITLFIRILFII